VSDRVRTTEEQHQYCAHNKVAIANSKFCGCFGCRCVFRASEVIGYGYAEDDFDENGEVVKTNAEDTAACPECGGPYVMPDNKVEITPELLCTMQEEWIEPDDDDEEEEINNDDPCGDCTAVHGSEACLTCDSYDEDDVETPTPDNDDNENDDDDKEEDDNPDE
jgi:hypothetical protein